MKIWCETTGWTVMVYLPLILLVLLPIRYLTFILHLTFIIHSTISLHLTSTHIPLFTILLLVDRNFSPT